MTREKIFDTLNEIDHIMTEVDLELYEWQTGLDMMSFIYVDASFELWTHDDPPRVVTPAVLAQAAGKELRVMHVIEGKPTQVGTAVVNSKGYLEAKLDKLVPGLTDVGPMAFSVAADGEAWTPTPAQRLIMPSYKNVVVKKSDLEDHGSLGYHDIHPPFEGFNKPLTIRGLEEAIAKEEKRREGRRSWLADDFENHPFFNKEN